MKEEKMENMGAIPRMLSEVNIRKATLSDFDFFYGIFGDKIGYLYLDIINKSLVEVAIAISEKYQGKELATQSLKKFLKIISTDCSNPEIVAWIFDSNIVSKKVFTKNGFLPTDEIKKKLLLLKNTNEIMRKYIYLNKEIKGDM